VLHRIAGVAVHSGEMSAYQEPDFIMMDQNPSQLLRQSLLN
jgi:hypothetical protein